MGAWGTGLYSSDMAADMRSTIKSVLRLPVDEDRIVDILRDCEGRAVFPCPEPLPKPMRLRRLWAPRGGRSVPICVVIFYYFPV